MMHKWRSRRGVGPGVAVCAILFVNAANATSQAPSITSPPSLAPPSAASQQGVAPADDGTIHLTLQDAVGLALHANYDIRAAWVLRVAQRYAVYQAQDKFRPHLSATAMLGQTFGSAAGASEGLTSAPGTSIALSPHAELLLPTGMLLSADLTQSLHRPSVYGQQNAQALTLTVTQPLLQNYGVAANRASMLAAALQDSVNQQTLRATLINTVGAVIFAYRQLTQDALLLDIAKKAVARAQGLLEINHQMVAAGRMARADLVQTEAEIANREVLAVNAESACMTDQLNLLNLLALGSDTPVMPVKEDVPADPLPELQQARAKALAYRPEYFTARLNKQIAGQQLVIAENNRKWQLNLTAQHTRGGVSNTVGGAPGQAVPGLANATFLGLSLSVPLLDVTLQQQVVNAEVSERQADVALEQVTNAVNVNVDTALRVLALTRSNYDFARKARDLADKKLNNEREKLSAGRSSNFVVLQYVDDLVTAESAEITAAIAYLNAATSLEIQQGSLIEPWNITIY